MDASSVRTSLVGNRLRPSDALPPYAAALRLGLAALAFGCLGLVCGTYAVGPSEPLVWLYGTGIPIASVLLMLLAMIVATWGVATVCAVARHPRLTLAAVVLLVDGVSLTILEATVQLARAVGEVSASLPSFRVEWSLIPTWVVTMVIVADLVAVVGLIAPTEVLHRRPVLIGGLASAPMWAALITWISLTHDANIIPFGLDVGLPDVTRLRLEAPRAAAALYSFTSAAAGALAGLVVVLILLSAAEFAAQQISWSARLSAWRAVAPRRLLAGLLAVKIAFLSAGYAGLLGNRDQDETWDRGSGWQWTFAGVAVAGGVAALRWEARHPVRSGGLRRFAALTVAGLAAPALLLFAGSVVQVVLGPLIPWQWAPIALTVAAKVLPVAALVTSVAVGGAALARWHRGHRTTGTVFGLAFGIWALPTAIQLALSGGEISTVPLLASAQRVDCWVTLIVLVAAARRPADVQARRLVFVLTGSSLVAFSIDLLLSDSAPDWGLVVLVLVPVVWRFVGDGRQERLLPAGRVVVAMCTWSVLVAVSGFTVGAGSGMNIWDVQDRPEWDLLVVPLTFALFCRTQPDADHGPEIGWRGSSVSRPPPRLSGRRQYLIAVAAGFWAAASAVSYVDRVAPPQDRIGPQLEVAAVPAGWIPGQCEGVTDADIVSVSKTDTTASVVAIHAARATVERTAAEAPDSCPEAHTAAPFITSCVSSADAQPDQLAGIAGWRYPPIPEGTVRCAVTDDGDALRVVLVLVLGPGDAETDREVQQVLDSLTFLPYP